nr:MFS transporter [Streptomyces sp. 1331.2]
MATIAQLAVALATSTSTVLLYDVMRDLDADSSSAQWMDTGHFLAFGALLFLGGHLADLIGRKTTLLIGLTGFTLTTAVQVWSTEPDTMLWAYTAQGVFAALSTPASFALVAVHFTGSRARTKAFGLYSLAALGGSVLGLFLAVPLAQYTTWRMSLYVIILLALIALAGTAALVRDLPDRTPAGFDALGALLSTLGVAAVVFALDRSPALGWDTPLPPLCLAGGVVLMAAFFRRQGRTPGAAILPAYGTGALGRRGALIALCLSGFALESAVPSLAEFLWSVGPGPGLVAFAVTAGSFLTGSLLLAAPLLPRVAFRALLVPGLGLAAVGVLLIGTGPESPAGAWSGLICLGVGLGTAATLLYSAITEGIVAHDCGGRAALAVTGQELGGSASAALLGGTVGLESGGHTPVALYLSAAALLIAALVGGLMVKGPESALTAPAPRDHLRR